MSLKTAVVAVAVKMHLYEGPDLGNSINKGKSSATGGI